MSPPPRLGGQTCWIDTPAGPLAAESVGSGPLLLAVHDLEPGAGRAEWGPLAALLDGYRLLALDLPGCGDTAAPALDAATMLTALRAASAAVGPCHLLGRGWGAAYLTHLAAGQPDQHPTLLAIAPEGLRPRPAATAALWELQAAVAELLTPAALTDWLRCEVWWQPAAVTPELVAAVAARSRPELLALLAAGRLEVDIRQAWIDAPQPVLLLWGEACENPPWDDAADFIMPLRPNAPFMMIDRRPVGVWKRSVTYKSIAATRRVPHLERPGAVAAVIREFLSWPVETP
ncbi:MAG: alpha/beta fold hydrolase [Fimbriimonadaceae bacterium]|nr:alpha/beta fold hydrolase [Fimbriimonadaceae bacterium]